MNASHNAAEQASRVAARPFLRLTRALAEASAFILGAGNRVDVTRVLQLNLRLQKVKGSEAAYEVLRLSTTLDMAPNPAAWKAVRRIVAKVKPKISQLDIDQIIDARFVRQLEASGFMAEHREKTR